MQRQAIVIVHGMGEQKPGDALKPFSQMVLGDDTEYYSRPTLVGDSFEARVHHVPLLNRNREPNGSLGTETDFYEYHWSYRMKDNRLADLGGVAYRTLLPTKGKSHLVFVAFALLAALGIASLLRGPWVFTSWLGKADEWLNMGDALADWDLKLPLWPTTSTGSGVSAALLRFGVGLLWSVVVIVWFVVLGLISDRKAESPRMKRSVGTIAWAGLAILFMVILWPFNLGSVIGLILVAVALVSMAKQTPHGLKATLVIVWAVLVAIVYGMVLPQWDSIMGALSEPETIYKVLVGGVGAFLLSMALGRVAPWLTTSFVDVVRYVDTSPRSYEVRREIRKGLADLLGQLHDRPTGQQYDRILIFAHSLGSYIAYDAISTLWFMRVGPAAGVVIPGTADPVVGVDYQAQQRDAFARLPGLPTVEYPLWRISHFVTYGSPMYMADRLVTKTAEEFGTKIEHHELLGCPPPNDTTLTRRRTALPVPEIARREVAAFGLVQWTNLYYRTELGIMGDPFGGPLAGLFGQGIVDRPIRDGYLSLVPYAAHAGYTRSILKDRDAGEDADSGTLLKTFAGAVSAIITVPRDDNDNDNGRDDDG